MRSRRRFVQLAAGASVLCAAAPAAAQPSPAQTETALFVFSFRPGSAWIEGRPMAEQALAPHGRYYGELLERGILFAAGGYVGSDGGMAIIRAADMDEARAVLAADPAIVSGVFVADLEQWRPRFRSDAPLP